MLCFDFIIRLGKCLLLVYVLMLDKLFDSYKQAFRQLIELFEKYKINELEVWIYNRNRATINALEAVFLGIESILYTQYIDTVVTVYTCKLFGQQKNKDSTRYIPSTLADEFLVLYRYCRYVLTETVFDKAYTALKERCKYSYIDDDNSNVEEEVAADEFNNLARPIDSDKRVLLVYNKDTTERQLKVKRYLEIVQQLYKEKCVKAQTDRIRHYGFDVLSASEGAYAGLKGWLTSTRNNTLTLFLKIALYFDSQRDRYNYDLLVAQNTTLNQFINKEFYYNVNSVIATRGLKIIYNQKQKLDTKLDNVVNDRDFVRSICTSIFTQTIGIACLYKLEDKTVLIVAEFDRFYYILGTIEAPSIRRLLEPAVRLRKRAIRLERSYKVGTGTSSNIRDRIGAKYDNPNLAGDDDDDDIDNKATLAQRNGKLQRPIQQQLNRRTVALNGEVHCNCLTGCLYSRYACLKAKQPYNARYKHKGRGYKNKFGTMLERLLTAALVIARLLTTALAIARLLTIALATARPLAAALALVVARLSTVALASTAVLATVLLSNTAILTSL